MRDDPTRPRRAHRAPAALQLALAVGLVLLAAAVAAAEPQQCSTGGVSGGSGDGPPACTRELVRGVGWGAATAAYQIEGGWNEGGRTPSVWDVWSQDSDPPRVWHAQNGSVACDHYHRWPGDVRLMRQLGIRHYRLSISWTRIVPGGFKGSAVNPAGVRFYKRLLQGLRAAGIEPLVTLFHWDLPQVLQDEYGGFASERLVEDFEYYADTVFQHLGQYVKAWVSFNEPIVTCSLGFREGTFPPGRKDGVAGELRCGHNVLLAHAAVVASYKAKYASQGGRISMALAGCWAIPNDASSAADQEAAELMMQLRWGWFADPLTSGDYPQLMKERLGSDLPAFTPEQRQLLKGSAAPFLAVNVYTSRFIAPGSNDGLPWVEALTNASGDPLGIDSDVPWLKVTPGALRGVLAWFNRRYPGVELMVTENGVPRPGESELPLEAALRDGYRIDFYRGYLQSLCEAVALDGARVSRYYAWSLMDNFEWLDGYRPRFGIIYVDYANDLTRHPKASAHWLSKHFFTAGASGSAEPSDSTEQL